jgi:hypothetical protein
MEPHLETKEKNLGVLNELKRREPVFHQPEFGTTRKDFETITADEFWETGASGNMYSREFVLDVLEKRAEQNDAEKWETKDFYCQEIAPGNYMLTYTLFQKNRMTRRMSIWRRYGGDWKIVYHQGTVVSGV